MNMKKEDFSRYLVYDGGKIYDIKLNRFSKIFRSNDYLQCRMVDNDGVVRIMGVHTAVCMFNHPEYFEGCVIHHIDGNKYNNYVSNLHPMTRSEHTELHCNRHVLADYIKRNGPANKGKKMSDDFREKCRQSAFKRWSK